MRSKPLHTWRIVFRVRLPMAVALGLLLAPWW